MGLKTKKVTIHLSNRDHGKKFLITEMPADQAEQWAFRALLSLKNSGAALPEGMNDENIEQAGMAAIANFGISILGSIDFDTVKPLLDEMMDCVQISMGERLGYRPLEHGESGDIEEVQTRLFLRSEVIALHTGFSIAEAIMTLAEKRKSKDSKDTSISQTSSDQ